MFVGLKKKKKKKSKKSSKKAKGEVEEAPESADAAASSSDAAVKAVDTTFESYEYGFLLTRFYDRLRTNNQDLVVRKRHVMKPPHVLKIGTSKTLWANFPEICELMKRKPDHVYAFFLAELGTTGSIDGSGRFVIKGKYIAKDIERLLRKYISEYVTCHMCKNPNTVISRDPVSRLYFVNCESCGCSRSVSQIQKGYHATGRGERRKERNK
jgi:translation initiation factor 2 subunit 2